MFIMNSEAITSWLIHANWFFLALWIALLAAAVGACFPARSASDRRPRSERNPS
jgi:hypothetical protein